jgi:hypothetical protein
MGEQRCAEAADLYEKNPNEADLGDLRWYGDNL